MMERKATKLEHANREKTTKEKINLVLDHYATIMFFTFITFFSLFFDDIKLVAFGKSVDDLFGYISFFCFLAFTIEVLLASYSK